MTTPDAVLDYWFGELDPDDPSVPQERYEVWFGKSDETDREIEERFGEAVEAAVLGRLDDWADTPRGRVALIVLLDQFTRNIYRGSARMFIGDVVVAKLSLQGLEGGEETGEQAGLHPLLRAFSYMPLMHSEDLRLQDLGVEVFGSLRDGVEAPAKQGYQGFYDYMVKHQVIVARFGRFPHRNAWLGRPSTAEEEAFLEGPDSSF